MENSGFSPAGQEEISKLPVGPALRIIPNMTKLIDRVGERMEALNLNPSSTARLAGLKPGYIQDILRGRIRDPSFIKLTQLARVLECDPRYLAGFQSNLGEAPSEDPSPVERVMLRVSYQLRAGLFEEISDRKPEPTLTFSVLNNYAYREHSQWLERMLDDSASKVVPVGYYVQVVDSEEINYTPEWGDLVIVERYKEGGSLVERTLREVGLGWDGDKVSLKFPSYNPRWDDTELNIAQSGDETGKIVGKVVYAYGGFQGSLNSR